MPRCLPRLPLPRFWACPRSSQWFAATLFLGGENGFNAAMPAAFAFAALMGWPSCFAEMHQPHVFLPQVLILDALIPVNEVRKACGIPEPV